MLPRFNAAVLSTLLVFLWACAGPKPASIEDLTHQQDLSDARLMTLRGTRQGDVLDAEAMYSARAMVLTLKLRFMIGTPTTLQSGTWLSGTGSGGSVVARDVSFLGGQGGSPSVGGTFDLLDASGTHKYRAVLPLLELKQRLDPNRTQP